MVEKQITQKVKIYVETLGCPKNEVDSRKLIANLNGNIFSFTSQKEKADVILVNTCGFILSAKEESLNTIMSFAQLKKTGNLQCLVVCGCLVQRYYKELKSELTEADILLPFNKYHELEKQILKFLNIASNNSKKQNICLSPRVYEYLKISQGCNNNCSYCAIPLIRGKLKSFSLNKILSQARSFIEDGVKELIIIAQDTGNWGIDMYGESRLHELLEKLNNLYGDFWIRVLYMHPAHLTDNIIEAIANLKKVCKYIDLPLQHISDKILEKMSRKIKRQKIEKLLLKLRDHNIIIRTTFIIGFPYETEKEFKELFNFVSEFKFDRAGFFLYSREEGTTAYNFKSRCNLREANLRLLKIMELQKNILSQKQKAMLKKKLKILVERQKENIYIGRSYMDAPEIDTEVLINTENLQAGKFMEVKITGTDGLDLFAIPLTT